jgi:hypothetical protein
VLSRLSPRRGSHVGGSYSMDFQEVVAEVLRETKMAPAQLAALSCGTPVSEAYTANPRARWRGGEVARPCSTHQKDAIKPLMEEIELQVPKNVRDDGPAHHDQAGPAAACPGARGPRMYRYSGGIVIRMRITMATKYMPCVRDWARMAAMREENRKGMGRGKAVVGKETPAFHTPTDPSHHQFCHQREHGGRGAPASRGHPLHSLPTQPRRPPQVEQTG